MVSALGAFAPRNLLWLFFFIWGRKIDWLNELLGYAGRCWQRKKHLAYNLRDEKLTAKGRFNLMS